MASKLVPIAHQRANQPQLVLPINWSNPIVQAIDPVAIYTPLNGGMYDWVGGKFATIVNGAIVEPSAIEIAGRSPYAADAVTTAQHWKTDLYIDSSIVFHFGLFTSIGSVPSGTAYYSGIHDGTNRFYLAQTASASSDVYLGYGGTAALLQRRTVAAAGKTESISYTVNNNVLRGYQDGVSIGENAATFSGTSAQPYLIGKRGTGTSGETVQGVDAHTHIIIIGRGNAPDDVHAALRENPWQVFSPIQRSIWIPSAGGGSTGTLAYTNANDAASASGTTTVVGTFARTNANDTAAGSGTTTVTGTLARTNANDTSAASGSVGSTITGTVAYTNANDTVSASGDTTVLGTLAKTSNADTSSASGTTTITGSLAYINANDAAAANGVTGAVSGSVAYTNAADTCIAYDVLGTTGGGSGEVVIKKVYIRRKKQILLFNDAQSADAWLAAEKAAEQAVEDAKRTSRRARKRLKERVYRVVGVKPAYTVEIDRLAQLIANFSIGADLPSLIARQDYERVMQIYARAMQMQDEEDIELLLLA